jgi:hypothetical protein
MEPLLDVILIYKKKLLSRNNIPTCLNNIMLLADHVKKQSMSFIVDLSNLPQPQNCRGRLYEYILYEDIEQRFLERLKPGTLCWVLKSKGQQQPAELFLRARVVTDDQDDGPERRILVRYPRGSTYSVKRVNLIPVLEPPRVESLVIVMAETPDYRRAAVIHTCIGDSFLEIGCDFGPTVDRVQRALAESLGVPLDPNDDPVLLPACQKGRVWCLGIDKGPESIEVATKRYPSCTFSLEDALTERGMKQLCELCETRLECKSPSVVALDIGGNREIPAVLQCLYNIMNPPSETWVTPRLILVKSRFLHKELHLKKKNAS